MWVKLDGGGDGRAGDSVV
ncbi:hypothetical protein A2U01_0064885, partial [Trifolium medium]|nr:hypothetical protein [Trifolium medium]